MGVALGRLADFLQAELRGNRRAVVRQVAPLHRAGRGDLSFLSNRRYVKHLRSTAATAVIVSPTDAEQCPVAALIMDNPYLGYARAAGFLRPPPDRPRGVHPAACVSPDAAVADSAWIGPHAVVEAGAEIGPGAFIGPGSVVGESVVVGEDSRLVANVTLVAGVSIGRRVLIHPGAVLGADGFGIANDDGVWVKVPQLGTVLIGDDVEIGANTTVDRGALEDTVIEEGVKIDNLVQVGHNVRIGAHTAIAGAVAIAGSARIGKRCTLAGCAAVAGHLEITDDVHLTGATLVHRSIDTPGVYSSGFPFQENRLWRRNQAWIRHLDELARRIRALERK